MLCLVQRPTREQCRGDDAGTPGTRAYKDTLNLLKELDKDFSGEISFEEFKYVRYPHLKIMEVLSSNSLSALITHTSWA